MGKSTRPPILAAGGIVIRNGAKPLVAVVQRRRDNAWVLPKGKLKPNEKPIAGARREAVEETGSSVRVYEYLGVISYVGRQRTEDRPLLAHAGDRRPRLASRATTSKRLNGCRYPRPSSD